MIINGKRYFIKWADTPEEVLEFIEEYKITRNKILAVKHNCSESAIRQRAQYLGIHKEGRKLPERANHVTASNHTAY